MKIKKYLSIFCACAALTAALGSCSSNLPPNTIYSAEDLNGKTVGVITNTAAENYLSRYSGNIYIRQCSDAEIIAQELVSGEIDAALADENGTADILNESSKLTVLAEPLINNEYCIAVSQENTTLLQNVNTALSDISKSGELAGLISGWLYGTYEYNPSGENYETSLAVAVCPDFWPYAFYDEEGELAGLEIDLIRLICDDLGVGVNFSAFDSDKLIYMVESGKVSLSIGRIVSGDAAVLYSDSYLTSVQNIIVRKD